MNIKKAIEIKLREGEEFLNTDPDDIEEAERLSIEAMKRLQVIRDRDPIEALTILPGETEE